MTRIADPIAAAMRPALGTPTTAIASAAMGVGLDAPGNGSVPADLFSRLFAAEADSAVPAPPVAMAGPVPVTVPAANLSGPLLSDAAEDAAMPAAYWSDVLVTATPARSIASPAPTPAAEILADAPPGSDLPAPTGQTLELRVATQSPAFQTLPITTQPTPAEAPAAASSPAAKMPADVTEPAPLMVEAASTIILAPAAAQTPVATRDTAEPALDDNAPNPQPTQLRDPSAKPEAAATGRHKGRMADFSEQPARSGADQPAASVAEPLPGALAPQTALQLAPASPVAPVSAPTPATEGAAPVANAARAETGAAIPAHSAAEHSAMANARSADAAAAGPIPTRGSEDLPISTPATTQPVPAAAPDARAIGDAARPPATGASVASSPSFPVTANNFASAPPAVDGIALQAPSATNFDRIANAAMPTRPVDAAAMMARVETPVTQTSPAPASAVAVETDTAAAPSTTPAQGAQVRQPESQPIATQTTNPTPVTTPHIAAAAPVTATTSGATATTRAAATAPAAVTAPARQADTASAQPLRTESAANAGGEAISPDTTKANVAAQPPAFAIPNGPAMPGAPATAAPESTVAPLEVTAPPMPLETERPEWQADLVARIAARMEEQGTVFEIALTPETLGDIEVRLELRDGKADVTFVTETREAARLINQSEAKLSELLARSGISLNSQDTAARDQSTSQQRQDRHDRPSAPARPGRDEDPTPRTAPSMTRRTGLNLIA